MFGPNFALLEAIQDGASIVKIRFTQDPVAVDPVGANDALNIGNYLVSGPAPNAITSASVVVGDSQAIRLYFQAPLAAGTWTVTANDALESTDSFVIQAPKTQSFTATELSLAASIIQGAVTESSADILRKHLSPALAGDMWDAVIDGAAAGDDIVTEVASSAFDQVFLSSASGIYLANRASDVGLSRPKNVGISDEFFRRYAIQLTADKLNHKSLYELMEIFYGSDAVRAYIETELTEPYVISEGDDLSVTFDGRDTYPLTFTEAEFVAPSQASGIEVAASITRQLQKLGSAGYAVTHRDTTTGDDKVRIYSPSLGLNSSVKITSGKAQTNLQFSTRIDNLYSGTPSWTITVDPLLGRATYTTTDAGTIDLTLVRIGDYVNIYDTDFLEENRGSFTIVDVETSYPYSAYFTIENADATVQAGVSSVEAGMMFFRPTRRTIARENNRTVIIAERDGGLDIQIPATSQAVSRTVTSAAYAKVNDSVTATIQRDINGDVVVTVPNVGPFNEGGWVFLDACRGSTSLPSTLAGNGTSTSDASLVSIWSDLGTTGESGCADHAAVLLSDDRVFIVGGETAGPTLRDAGEIFEVTSITSLPQGERYNYTWTSTTVMPAALRYISAIAVGETGDILVCGGNSDDSNTPPFVTTVADTYVYHTAGDTWDTVVAPAPFTARVGHTLVDLNGEKVLSITGATDLATPTSDCFLFDIDTQTWATAASTTWQTCDTAAVLLDDGNVFACGGRLVDIVSPYQNKLAGTSVNYCEIYDVAGDSWSLAAKMNYCRHAHALIKLPDGRVMAIGGRGHRGEVYPLGAADVSLLTTEIYNPRINLWQPGPSMRATKLFPRAFYDADQTKIYVVDGATAVEYLDLETMTWHYSTSGLTPSDRSMCVPVGMATGAVITTGGGTYEDDNFLFIPASEQIYTGGLNDLFRITAKDVGNNTFTVNSPEFPYYTVASGVIVTRVEAETDTNIPGPYIYDPDNGFAITSVREVLDQDLAQGLQYASITLNGGTPSMSFPDEEGWLVFGFGTEEQVGPVKYLGRESDNTLLLDYGFRFPKNIGAGATVILLNSKSTFSPDSSDLGNFYATDSAAGRRAALGAIELAKAAGIDINTTVIYPGDEGLGAEGHPTENADKISDIVGVFSSNDIDAEITEAKENG